MPGAAGSDEVSAPLWGVRGRRAGCIRRLAHGRGEGGGRASRYVGGFGSYLSRGTIRPTDGRIVFAAGHMPRRAYDFHPGLPTEPERCNSLDACDSPTSRYYGFSVVSGGTAVVVTGVPAGAPAAARSRRGGCSGSKGLLRLRRLMRVAVLPREYAV